MIPKHYSLVKEHQHSYEIHDARDGNRFHIAKSGLDLGMHAKLSKIQNFDEGGKAKTLGQTIGFPESRPVQNYAEGTPDEPVQSEEIPYDKLIPQEQADNAPYGTPAPAPSATPAPGVSATAEGAASDAGPLPTAQNLSATPHDPIADFTKIRESGLDKVESGINTAQGAEMAAQKNIGKAWKDYGTATDAMKTPDSIIASGKMSDSKYQEAIEKQHIDPERYWNSKSTGAKIAASLGMILGGLGAGMTGGPNQALQTINSAIDRDIDAQKNDQSKTMNLWKMNREATQSELEANLHTRNQMLTAVEAKVKGFAASAGGAEAMMKFAPMLMEIQKEKSENYLRMGLAKGDMQEMDPSSLVKILVKDPAQQNEVAKHIDVAKAITANKQVALDAFDRAVKENTILRTGAGLVRTPASIKALHQASLPMFADIDGTVRQAAMDETFHNIDPKPGDLSSTSAEKRIAYEHWIDAKQSASSSIAKANGIDLSKFRVTAGQIKPQQQTATRNGVPYVKVPGGWRAAR